MVQLGMFKAGRVLAGAAVAALALTTLNVGSAQAADTTLLSTELGGGCAPVVDSPSAGLTTVTDTTVPTVTSVAWSHTTYTAKAKAVARVTVRLTDDCAGSGDVVLELHNATTGDWAYPFATSQSWVPTATGINEVWTFDIPLHGTDAGGLFVVKVDVISGFQTMTYASGAAPTEADITDIAPDPNRELSPDDYTRVSPPATAKTVVKAFTTLTANATPEPAKVGRSVTVKATLRKLKTSTYVADPSQYVTLQYHLPGSSTWHSIKKVKTNSLGVASTTFKVTRKGTYGFRAVYAGATYAAAVNSSSDAVSVRSS